MKALPKYFFMAFFCLCIACKEETKNEEKREYSPAEGQNPQVDIKVNKKYDDEGNLIRYDSTYSYFYSTDGKDSVLVSIDSMFRRFRSYFNENFSSRMDRRFDELFWNDSLFKYDFLNQDFFIKRFELNRERMDSLFKELDSLKNDFLKTPNKEKTRAKTSI